MPPSTRLASSSRNSQSSRIFKKALTAEGLNRFSTSLLERSTGISHAMPAVRRLSVAIPCSRYLQIWSIIHPLLELHSLLFFDPYSSKLSIPCSHLNLGHLRAPKSFNCSGFFETSECHTSSNSIPTRAASYTLEVDCRL